VQTINHNTAAPGYSSLKAIPINGPVKVQVLSGDTLFGETTTNPNGEWETGISVPDGDYTVRFEGLFHPIGESNKSKYLSRVKQKDVAISVVTEEASTSLGGLKSVIANTPQKDVFFGSDGKNWRFLSIKNNLVDLTSMQSIRGHKTFMVEADFDSVVTLRNRLKFQGSTPAQAFTASTIPDGYIYLSGSNELTFEDGYAGSRTLSSLGRLSLMSDVIAATPTNGNLLAGNGTYWTSAAPDELGLMTKAGIQTITGQKMFSDIVLNGNISGSSVITDLSLASSNTLATSLAIKQYIDASSCAGTAADIVFNETPSGTPNGVLTTFGLAYAPVAADTMVFLNGQLQTRGALSDYTISGQNVVFSADRIPNTGDVIVVTYRKSE
jgi:hypothetical protein